MTRLDGDVASGILPGAGHDPGKRRGSTKLEGKCWRRAEDYNDTGDGIMMIALITRLCEGLGFGCAEMKSKVGRVMEMVIGDRIH